MLGTILLGTANVRAAEPISVWFRGADGCPSGDAFLARLREHAVEARLASVGDRIDFVVTLGQRAGKSSATLERQSAEGTVALREVNGSSCSAVAEALALTLALAVDPDTGATRVKQTDPAGQTSAIAPAPVSGAPEAAPQPASADTAVRSPLPPSVPRTSPAGREHAASTSARADDRLSRWVVGLQGGVGSIVSGAPLWGAAVFTEVRATSGLMPAARLSVVAGESNDPVPNVTLNLVAGRLEGCPIFVGRTLAAGACAAIELGRLGASSSATGGRADASFWSALWAIARVRYLAEGSGFSAEIQGGLTAPLTRYRIAGDVPVRTLVEVRPVGIGLAAGAGVAVP